MAAATDNFLAQALLKRKLFKNLKTSQVQFSYCSNFLCFDLGLDLDLVFDFGLDLDLDLDFNLDLDLDLSEECLFPLRSISHLYAFLASLEAVGLEYTPAFRSPVSLSHLNQDIETVKRKPTW